MPSSTSNSEIFNEEHESPSIETHDEIYKEELQLPYRIVPKHSWLTINISAAVLLVLAVAGWEMLSREMNHTPGNYQNGDSFMWAQERSKLDQANDQSSAYWLKSDTLGFRF